MSEPAANLADLESLKQSRGWVLVVAALTAQIEKACVPPQPVGSVDEIAVAAVQRAASYTVLRWTRDKMLDELITRERKALNE